MGASLRPVTTDAHTRNRRGRAGVRGFTVEIRGTVPAPGPVGAIHDHALLGNFAIPAHPAPRHRGRGERPSRLRRAARHRGRAQDRESLEWHGSLPLQARVSRPGRRQAPEPGDAARADLRRGLVVLHHGIRARPAVRSIPAGASRGVRGGPGRGFHRSHGLPTAGVCRSRALAAVDPAAVRGRARHARDRLHPPRSQADQRARDGNRTRGDPGLRPVAAGRQRQPLGRRRLGDARPTWRRSRRWTGRVCRPRTGTRWER